MKRPVCAKCSFIKVRCICDYINKFQSKIPIVIFREHKEAKHPFNTVNILKLNLSPINIIDLNPDNAETLNNVINETLKEYHNPLLIFPGDNSLNKKALVNSLDSFDALVFIDGTWKKSKKIFFQSSLLQKLNSYKIDIENKSTYEIRKSSLEYSLSTIEAVSEVLKLFETSFNDQEFLNPFFKMIEIQKNLIPKKRE